MLHFINKPDESFEQALQWLETHSVYAVDTETNGLDPHTNKVLLIQIGNEEDQWVFDTYKLKKQMHRIFPYLEDPNRTKILHNSQFDYKMLLGHYKIKMKNMKCTMLLEQLLTKGKRSLGGGPISVSLVAVASKYLNVALDKEERASFISKTWGTVITKEQIQYSGHDIKYLIKIYNEQMRLIKEMNMEIVTEVEFEAASVFGDMSYNGIFMNTKEWLSLENKAEEKVIEVKTKLDAHFKEILENNSSEDLFGKFIKEVNYDSPKQLLPLLRKVTGIPLEKTDAKYLEDYTFAHKVIEDLVNYRKERKKITTYGSTFLENIHPETGRVHSNFKQIYADTGRTSSENPNMQNIPKEQDYRSPFCVQDPNWDFLSADFSGQELRILAYLSGEPQFKEALRTGKDLHSYSASLLFNVPYENFLVYDSEGKQVFDAQGEAVINEEMRPLRNKCKSVTFGLLYGAGPKKLSTQIKITYEEAKQLMDRYFKVFPKIKKLMDTLSNEARKSKKAVSPLDGRIIDLGGIDWANKKLVAHALNQAKNLPFQGCGASITKLALCYISREFEKQNLQAILVNVVHDEILVNCPKTETTQIKQIVEQQMIQAFNYFCPGIPMKVIADIGDHWLH